MNTHLLAALLVAAGALGASTVHAREVRIGFLTTLSGPGGALGVDIRDGFALAAKLHGNKLGGIDTTISYADDQQNPETSMRIVDRYLKQDNVDIITGMVFANALLPVAPRILKSDTIYISPNVGPENYAGEGCDKNFFVVSWQSEDIPSAMGKYASDKGYKSISLVAPNFSGGRESLGGFKRLYKGKIVDEIYSKIGQLDFASEIATIRANKPEAVFFFLPGAMGINFIKQYQVSGLAKEVPLLTSGFSADEDTLQAVGDSMVGMLNSSHWAADLDNPSNKKFVEEFKKAYGRWPSMFAEQGYEAALLIDSAVRKVGADKIGDKDALRAALKAADFPSTRGAFRFNTNNYPIQTYYMREVRKFPDGSIHNVLVGTAMENHQDSFAAQCKM